MIHGLDKQYYVIRYKNPDGSYRYSTGQKSRVPKLYLKGYASANCGVGGEVVPVKITPMINIVEDNA